MFKEIGFAIGYAAGGEGGAMVGAASAKSFKKGLAKNFMLIVP